LEVGGLTGSRLFASRCEGETLFGLTQGEPWARLSSPLQGKKVYA
jgi:hypothetical protein